MKNKASNIDDSWFIAFLEQHHLSIKVHLNKFGLCYFLPSLLSTKPDYDRNLTSKISPIYIVPRSGYIATGLFTRLLTALAGVTYGSTVWRIPFPKGYINDVCRNQFEFVVSESVYIVLTEFSKHIRIDCLPLKDVKLVEEYLYSSIVSTLNVQLQRIVPQWINNRDFDITFLCTSDQCPRHDHFLLPIQSDKSQQTVECTYGKKSLLKPSQRMWLKVETSPNYKLFEKSLKEGSLDITITSVMFTGLNSGDCVNAKRIVFQEPISSNSARTPTHEIYFKPEGHLKLAKFQNEEYIDAILFSFTAPSSLPQSLTSHKQMSPELSITMSSQRKQSSHSTQFMQSTTTSIEEASTTSEMLPTSSDLVTQMATSMQPNQPSHQPDMSGGGTSEVKVAVSEPVIRIFDEESELKDSADIDYLIQQMVHYRSKGKIEIIHVFNCEYYQHISEILKMFINIVTLSVIVTSDISEPFHLSELDIVKDVSSLASKGMILASNCTPDDYNNAKNMAAQQFSKFLIPQEGKPGNYIFPINFKEPQNKDHKIGADIVNYALRSASSQAYPSSWYIFGFMLHSFMISNNMNAVKVSKHATKIAKKLEMELPSIEAALEHLTENNVVLYFRDILPDTVFVGMNPFVEICLGLFYKHEESGIKLQEVLEVFERHANLYVSVNDFVLLFNKLMIMIEYKGSYLVPSFLPLLSEIERVKSDNYFSVEPLFIECPSSGYEFISMLVVYLITLPNNQWKILEDKFGKPVCLYRNCTEFFLSELNCVVILRYKFKLLEINCRFNSTSELQSITEVLTTILQGLEKIKFRLSSYKHFDFYSNLSFECNCGRGDTFHTAIYSQHLDKLICKKSKLKKNLNDVQNNWLLSLKSGQGTFKEYLTVSSAVRVLARMEGEWIKVSELLNVPYTVVDSTLLLRLQDRDSLQRVVEWWFKNTANPEWTTIQSILRPYSDPYQDPLTVTEVNVLSCPGLNYQPFEFTSLSYGKWMLFRNFEELNNTWCVVREEVKSGRLGATGALCNTLRYDPVSSGAGPSTTGRITVFTKEENFMDVGMKLIKLPVVQHDIKYKTQEDTRSKKFAHMLPGQKIAKYILYWNGGQPSTHLHGIEYPANRADSRSYDPATDRWKINIVKGLPKYSSNHTYGRWIIQSNYDHESDINISTLWHTLKPRVEKGELPAIMMECPAPKQKIDPPEIHIFTSEADMTTVGMHVISLVNHDITYVIGDGDDRKILYWNDGYPRYAQGQDKTALRASDPDQDPLTVTETDVLRCPAPSYTAISFETEAYGKWIFFRNFEDLNDTWRVIRDAIRSNYLNCTGAMCNTLRYNPLGSGTGPKTTGRVMVFTKEDDHINVGMKLIRLPVVQHDIKYKTQQDTIARKLAFMDKGRPTTLTLFWNNGAPSTTQVGRPRYPRCRNDKYYDPTIDKWKINIVNGATRYRSEKSNGKWILNSNYDVKSELNITNLWHTLKPRIESGDIPAIKMECPASYQKKDPPQIYVFTSKLNMTEVGKKIIYLMQKDISYVVGGGTFRDDFKTLYWNHGEPGYERGSQRSWRK